VVEHDAEVIRAADHVVELGPGSGENGGQVLFNGSAERFLSQDTPTARSLRDRGGGLARRKRRILRRFLQVSGARLHNLKGETVRFGLGAFNCLTGVSGSGKSSLAAGVLEPALSAFFKSGGSPPPDLEGVVIQGAEMLEAVVMVDQSPIGRTPRSNPVTYVKAFEHIRKLFAATSGAKRLGLAAGDFSFNTAGGRCEKCKGAGFELVDMQFMADVLVPCEECGGKRFARRALTVTCRGLTVDRVLEMTVNEAIAFFADQAALGKQLWVLQSVGLGYLRLGQSATTLSGGESQRLKIARQLSEGGAARSHKGRLFIFDEPTTGLHAVEVAKLVRVLDKLVETGHTVLVIEHHPAVISHADWIVDLGPEGGDDGGWIVVQGPPEEVARCRQSHTGRLLAGLSKG
jgi:excinuclease ABC subunit A